MNIFNHRVSKKIWENILTDVLEGFRGSQKNLEGSRRSQKILEGS